MASPSESRSLLPSEFGNSTPSAYGASLNPNDNPEFTSRNVLERNVLRKLDFRTAYLVLIYILNQMDRHNAAAARLRGFEEDLGMEGTQFNTLISSLYIGYLFTQAPSNMILTRITKPSLYLSSCMSLWGLLTTLIGVYYQALSLRFLVGFLEATFYPGALYLLSRWYKREELGYRTAFFMVAVGFSNAFGSLFAFGILATMEGFLGYAAWRWLFFVEGYLTVFVGICGMFILPDFPSSPARWLTSAELSLARKRMEEDLRGYGPAEPNSSGGFSDLLSIITDWSAWLIATASACCCASLSFNQFFPTLVATMGYSPTISLLLCAPPCFVSIITAIIVARHSDATRERFGHMVFALLMLITGYIVAMSTMNITIRYLSLFFMAQSQVSGAVLLTWISNTFAHSSSKRAVAIGSINSIAMLGSVLSSYIWVSSRGPTYNNSCRICVALASIAIILCWVFKRHLERLNEATEAEERELRLPKGYRYIL
ncbi:major facilitator superfamily domain-containing protein [Suillus subaureus]|uniref:Major facilitator superfamily domain-containing protein n=1 Tax=Suillus subaureus TaxID=48587 RepID=A0A9P7EKZ1_9AGAM|nr:major facilitator superfamily domain-containing protein [Suillus subaureus]KAG1823660.1 major facilitator superfamily domain-containing protein [Suillus subaureus]